MSGYTVKYTQQDGTGGGEAGSFTITGLPALGENEAYDIYYTARLQDAADTSNGYIAVSNEAAAKDSSQTVTTEAAVEISRRMVHKEAAANEGTGNVQWTVLLNEDGPGSGAAGHSGTR